MINQELGSIFILKLWWRPNDDVEGKYHPRQSVRYTRRMQDDGSGAMYMQAIVEGLNKGFLIYLFSTQQKLFSSKYDPSEEEVLLIMSKQWLKRGHQ
jgi:hypothetical protein